ncbi:MAG: hypothetical protein KA236_12190 [Verrucomicrobia bacterium]|nr:hypothetical protein [Verrucomicrobiota bacterium]
MIQRTLRSILGQLVRCVPEEFFAWRSSLLSGWTSVAAAVLLMVGTGTSVVSQTPAGTTPAWAGTHSPWNQPDFFPIGVWLQSPANAGRYRAAGINTYVGLWKGPTEAQLTALKQAGLYVICDQNKVALRNLDQSSIIAWMHGDEPDNAQSLGEGRGWGPPIPPAQIVADYHRLRTADPTRPVLLNLGQGVAWDGWHGRGVRSNHPEDYPEYLKGCDIASFDIYPAVHDRPAVAGNLWFVAHGVERLIRWGKGKKPVWTCIECTHISNPARKATPHEVRAEVWMALIHGARGLIYFVHQFKPRFIEAALLTDPEMLAAVTALNREIQELAPVLNRPTVANGVRVQGLDPDVPVATMVKRYQGATYLFAVAMRNGATPATFTIPGFGSGHPVEVLGENRKLTTKDSRFTDHFKPWDVHLYRLPATPQP